MNQDVFHNRPDVTGNTLPSLRRVPFPVRSSPATARSDVRIPRRLAGAWKGLASLLLLLSLGLVLSPAHGQDAEPNNSCLGAQDLGAISLPYSLDGDLYPSPDGDPYISLADVDYFRFTATPGTLLQIDQARVSMSDPALAAFDSSCPFFPNWNWVDDNGGGDLNARLKIEVPANGTVVIAASAFPDYYYGPYQPFSGFHWDQGTYQLTVTELPVIGSISGRAVDRLFGGALRGDAAPYAVADLQRCDSPGSCYSVASQPTDSAGQFRFKRVSWSGQRLEPGAYRVSISANEYQPAQSAEFAVAEGQDFLVPDILVNPFPVKITEIRPCGDLPPEGGTCRFSFRVRNQMTTALTGKAWSLVENGQTGSFIPNTRFQAGAQGLTNLATGASRVASFSFRVPATLTDGWLVCVTAFVGQGADPFFAPVGTKEPLFCILKGFTGGYATLSANGKAAGGGFQVLSPEESEKLYHRRRQ